MVNTRSKRTIDTNDVSLSPAKRKRTSSTKKDHDDTKTTTTTTNKKQPSVKKQSRTKQTARMSARKTEPETTNKTNTKKKQEKKQERDENENAADRSHSEAHASAALHSDTSMMMDIKQNDDTNDNNENDQDETKSISSTSEDGVKKPTLYELLTKDTVKQLLQEKQKKGMVTIEHNATLRTCIEKMAEHNVLSLPVVAGMSLEDAEEGDGTDESGQFMGNLDVSAIMHAFIQHMDANGSDPFHVRQFWDRLVITVHSNDADLSVLMKTEENCTLRDLIHQCFFVRHVNKIPLTTTTPKTEPTPIKNNNAALPLPSEAVPIGYVHRVAVFDARGQVREIISQTDLIRYLSSHLSSHGSPLLSRTLEKLGFSSRVVHTVSHKMTAIAALRIVDEQEWTGAAIVDEKKHLVGSLTTNDLRGVTMSDLDHVLEPVSEWLKRIAVHSHREALPLQYVIPAHTIRECIDGMLLDGIHRLYIVESYEKPTPIGIITLTDLLELLFTHY